MQLRQKSWLRIFIAIVFASAVVFSVFQVAQAQVSTDGEPVVIYIFWGDGCPHCANAKLALEGLAQANSNVEIRAYEVWYDEANQALFAEMSAASGFTAKYVPTIFIGEYHWEGFSENVLAEIEQAVEEYSSASSQEIAQVAPTATVTSPPSNQVFNLPIVGTVDFSTHSLFINTLIIAFIDGVNPCSIWVLTMLLALTLHTGSRKKVLLIGAVFLTVTAVIYALFIAGLFTVLSVFSFIGWIQVVVALFALFFASVNIKDYFWYKEGLSFTISEEHKPGIFQRLRKVMDASQSVWGLVGATIVMAGGVSLVEFSCTAGFPVVWTNLLSAQNVTAGTFVMLLLVYMLIYQLDEFVIFGTAVLTLKSKRMEEKHGRILKLIGGTLMFTLGVVMLVNPNLMGDINSSLIIFGVAFVVAMFILLVHRVILPQFGIWIGTEEQSAGTPKN
jgi:thiol-disulfide isomerase/thioredoxin